MVEKIKELCKIKKISISKLEKQAGLGNGTIGKWEKFMRKPKYESLKSIAEVLDVPLSVLTGEEQKEKPPDTGELSEADMRVLKWFRSLPPEKQKAILIAQDGPVDAVE